jgi:hypothetical protein
MVTAGELGYKLGRSCPDSSTGSRWWSKSQMRSVLPRSWFLPTSRDDEVDQLFRRYVAIRLESVLRTEQGSSGARAVGRRGPADSASSWQLANEAAEAEPRSIPLGLFTHAMNELIDIKATRDTAVANHVPESVLHGACAVR